LTPLAILIGLWSAGAGHGDYVWARIVYPVPSLAIRLLVPELVADVSLAVGLFQFVLYGFVLDLASRSNRILVAALLVAAVHFALVASLFTVIRWD
jgi:hypothetical protein